MTFIFTRPWAGVYQVYLDSVAIISSTVLFYKHEKNRSEFSHAPPERIYTKPDENKQWSLGWLYFYKFARALDDKTQKKKMNKVLYACEIKEAKKIERSIIWGQVKGSRMRDLCPSAPSAIFTTMARKGNGANPKGNDCFECGAPGHFKKDYPKLKNKDGGNGSAQGWVYAVRNAEKKGNASRDPDSNVVTGTFLLNNRYASILFDTGADRSFISCEFSSLINITPTPLENSYDVELADGKIVRVDTILRCCTLNFLNHPFNIDLIPVKLGSFDVIIGMDWLRRCHAVIVCDEKLDRAQEYMAKGCQIFLAQISAKKEEDKSEGKQLKDVPIVRDFPEVSRNPVALSRRNEWQTKTKMKELSEQLQELSDKGFIRPSSSHWGASRRNRYPRAPEVPTIYLINSKDPTFNPEKDLRSGLIYLSLEYEIKTSKDVAFRTSGMVIFVLGYAIPGLPKSQPAIKKSRRTPQVGEGSKFLVIAQSLSLVCSLSTSPSLTPISRDPAPMIESIQGLGISKTPTEIRQFLDLNQNLSGEKGRKRISVNKAEGVTCCQFQALPEVKQRFCGL
ncbi:putative reverse transcriptase domain-containing protein [Tanacetum coccineum]|uniref:Reverse transcriptase domain-containing protein n=1 Tax=Tanacetum coccineum TaxID=301880 RepID=A0ABQ5BKK3_9ASTR